jgi:aspartyl-tRNA synthetase
LKVELSNPIPEITSKEALEKYGSNKPHLRIPLELNVFSNSPNKSQYRIVVLKLPGSFRLSRKQLDGYTEFVNINGIKSFTYI